MGVKELSDKEMECYSIIPKEGHFGEEVMSIGSKVIPLERYLALKNKIKDKFPGFLKEGEVLTMESINEMLAIKEEIDNWEK